MNAMQTFHKIVNFIKVAITLVLLFLMLYVFWGGLQIALNDDLGAPHWLS